MGIPFESKRRFRVNPVEVVIFAVISLIFVKSGYSLLYTHDGFDPIALTTSAENSVTPVTGRAPASVTPVVKNFTEVKIGCEPDKEGQSVNAKKIRLIGTICDEVDKINVVNTSAKVTATVFPDFPNQKFSTDYISLAQGKNVIYVEYQLKDGKILGREFSITQN